MRSQPARTFSAHHGVTDVEEAQAMGELQPRMRAGDKDRHQVVELLGKHFGEGRLTVEEFDERVVRAHASVYLDELPALTVDLPGEPQPHPQPQYRRRSRPQLRVPAFLFVLIALFLAWSMVAAVVYGAPPVFALLLLFLFLRHRRWSRRW
jgi:hypothetical protein